MKTKMLYGLEVGVRTKDIKGETFGKLEAVRPVGKSPSSSNIMWEFVCECGESVIKIPSDLTNRSHCGCFSGKDIKGDKYGKLTAVSRLSKSSNGDFEWLCLCDCGKEHITTIGRLRSGHTKSCGCVKKEAVKLRKGYHGKQGTPAYNSWRKIRERCFDKNCKEYKNYGAKGISMQEDWNKSFSEFYDYIGDPPDNGKRYTIDRIDNSKGYEEGNIRWATLDEQARNKNKSVLNSSGVTGVRHEKKTCNNGRYSIDYWVAQWRWLDGTGGKKCFSVDKYGEELAFFLACEMREAAIERLNAAGAGYTENHGK